MLCSKNIKKKIGLYLSTVPHGGGKFQYTMSMLDAVASLPKEKFTIVVAYSAETWNKYLANYKINKIFVPEGFSKLVFDRIWRNAKLPISVWRKISRFFCPLAKTLIRQDCDLWIFPAEEALSYQIEVPAVCSIFDLMHRYETKFPEVSAFGRAKRRDHHYKSMCKYVKGVIVDSEVGRQHVIESYHIKDDFIYPLPYIAPPYLEANRSAEHFKLEQQLPNKFIFYPAQYWEHKNHKRLIKAIANLKPQLPDIKLVLVGSKKNAFQSIAKLITELGLHEDVITLGYVPDEDMSEIYKRARALIMPTFFGPTNIPPLEAFVMGCPVAISNIYGMPEQVGDAALLFNPLSTDEIANVIKKLWCDDELCSRLKEKGIAKARSWGQTQFNQRFEQILSHLLNK